ncbi:MAG: NADH-quinone oxidoreductase subunit NuoN [Campylobacterales bacterium]|nr:NADH-quinone oxidoreductase subunit NuoN [Campylobacterales bacterium]
MLEKVVVDLASLNIVSISPMLIAIIGALAILCIDLVTKNLNKSFYTILTILFILVDLGAVIGYKGEVRGFFDVMLIDGISILSQSIILIASALFIPLALSTKRFHEFTYPEFFALFLFMISGFQFMISTDNLILIFVGLETASLSLYTLIALHNRMKSFEAAIKYFTMGAFAAGFYSFGCMILYALTGSVELNGIFSVLSERQFEPMILVLTALIFLIGAFGFKLSIVPFHTWTPDVYEGSSAALAGYMSIVPKVAGFVVIMRIFEFFVASGIVWLEYVLYAFVVITMTLANILALVQEDVKRMLAFSSISHAGFVLAGILIGTTQSNSALFIYWIMFLFTNLGAFTMLWVSRHKNAIFHNRFDHPYTKFAGMIKIMPVGAVIMGVFMLSLAGVPPFSLFWGKMYMLSSAVNAGYIGLALIMALNSAIAAYYYLKLIVYMFLKEPVENDHTIYIKNASNPLKTIIGFSAIVTIFSIFIMNPLIEIATKYVEISGF